jgi:hypothetical protein
MLHSQFVSSGHNPRLLSELCGLCPFRSSDNVERPDFLITTIFLCTGTLRLCISLPHLKKSASYTGTVSKCTVLGVQTKRRRDLDCGARCRSQISRCVSSNSSYIGPRLFRENNAKYASMCDGEQVRILDEMLLFGVRGQAELSRMKPPVAHRKASTTVLPVTRHGAHRELVQTSKKGKREKRYPWMHINFPRCGKQALDFSPLPLSYCTQSVSFG